MNNKMLKAVGAWAVRFTAEMFKASWIVAARIIVFTMLALPVGAAVWTVAPDLAKVTVFITAYILCALDRSQLIVIGEEADAAAGAGQLIGTLVGLVTGGWAAYWFYWLFFPMAVAIALCVTGKGA